MDNFLNFYSKYPWVAIVIVLQWLATAFVIIYTKTDITKVMGISFISTVIFAYIGFKLPKG
jgi:hypothetical protein